MSNWAATYGGSDDEEATSILQTSDGGYIVAGYTNSFGSGGDIWILKLNENGSVEWQKAYGRGSDMTYFIQQTSDGGYIVVGVTESLEPTVWWKDIWVLKLDENGNVEWQKTYGEYGVDIAESIQLTSDGGYIVAGYTYSFGAGYSDVW